MTVPGVVGTHNLRARRSGMGYLVDLDIMQLLPPETQLQGRCFDVSPHVTSTLSHGIPTISAATRWQSIIDSVPRLPMPVCTSGVKLAV